MRKFHRLALIPVLESGDATRNKESQRHGGVLLLVTINYDNRKSSEPKYTISVRPWQSAMSTAEPRDCNQATRVLGAEYKAIETVWLNNTARMNFNRHGASAICAVN